MQKKTLEKLLAHGVKLGASDLHFLVGDQPAYRIDGTLRPVKMKPLGAGDARRICEHLLGASPARENLDEIQEHDCSYSVDGVGRFRVNLFRQRGSLSAILRVIPTQVPDIDSLDLPERIRGLAEEERGLVVVWSEHGGPVTSAPTTGGIGLRLIRGLIEHELGGKIVFDFTSEGLRVKLMLPVSGEVLRPQLLA